MLFAFLHVDIPSFFLVASHTKPTDAPNEIDGLEDVYNVAVKKFLTSAGMILGDLNADCSYLSNTKYYALNLILNSSFTWWIDKEADTTTGTSDCAYDRYVFVYQLMSACILLNILMMNGDYFS